MNRNRFSSLCFQRAAITTCDISGVIAQNFTDWFSVNQRCDTPDALLENGCARSQLEFPVSNSFVLQDHPLGRQSGNSTQISPQKMALKLRPGPRSTLYSKKLEMEFTDAGKSCLTSPFISRHSSHFPSQDPTHRGLSCGPVLSDGPVRVHVRRSAEDKGPGLHSV